MSKGKVTEVSVADLVPDNLNFNRGTEYGNALLEKSFQKFGAGRSILLDKNNRIIAGNKAAGKYGELGGEKVIVVETDGDTLVAVKRTDVDLDSQAGRELALADNATQRADLEWDTEIIKEAQEKWGLDADAWGVKVEWLPEDETAEIERKRREFEGRIAAGEISEEDEEYQEFLDKFKLKKTTDACYTPPIVYDAVADCVANEYGLSKANFVRPFYPGGDYQKGKYKPSDVVVDNPPFSILAEILNFYKEHGIRFFLFAPTLTLFSSFISSSSSALPCGVVITYANGANVNTSFLTDLEPKTIRVRSRPTLYEAVKTANDINLAQMRKSPPKYSYDHHIITAPFIGALSRLGIDFSVPVAESEPISQLDCQKESGKSIYGRGYIVGERVSAEREKAEREKAERWELSDREKAIVAKLSR